MKPEDHGAPNSFSLGAQIGGPDSPRAVEQQEQRLRTAFNNWKGDYTKAIREFAFLLRVDGSLIKYTREWKIVGPQQAKRKRDWVEVEIGVPQSWWLDGGVDGYKRRLAASVETGLHSMIELLKRNRYEIAEQALLADWFKVKEQFLGDESWRLIESSQS